MKICQKFDRGALFGTFWNQCYIISSKKLSFKTLVTLLEEAQFISSNLNGRVARKK